jgi:hypothetical protein
MQYEEFSKKGFPKEFKDQPGLYIISIPGSQHTVLARNLPLGDKYSENLKRGQRLLKFGMAPRSLSSRIADYGTVQPNGFLIHAIFITRRGRDLDTGYKTVLYKDKHGVNRKKKIATDTSHTWKSEMRLKTKLQEEGAIYFRQGRNASQTDWTGIKLDKLKKIMNDLHQASRDNQGSVWFFDVNDATLQNNGSGQKLSDKIARTGYTPKPPPPVGHRVGLRSGAVP